MPNGLRMALYIIIIDDDTTVHAQVEFVLHKYALHVLAKCEDKVYVYLSDGDVLKLGGEGEDSEELNLTEGGLHHLVVGGHCLVGQVVVRGNPTQLCHLVHRDMRRGRKEGELRDREQ